MRKSPIVAFSPCGSYDASLAASLNTLVGHFGGWSALVKPGQKVLVKPNLLADAAPEKAVTTHPELVRQVIRGLKSAGASVQVGDSPASAVTLERVWRVTGIQEICAAENVPLVSFEQSGTKKIERDGFAFTVANAVMETELIINLPKVKSHGLTTMTAATKNFYGTIPGYQKAQLHQAYPRPVKFCRLLRAIYDVMPPSFSIADGVIGMEGEGPSNGHPIPLGFLAASPDAIALDLALCQALGVDARRVPYLADCLTPDDAGKLFDLRGAMPVVKRFRAPAGGAHMMRFIPEPLFRLAAPFAWIRPAFNEKCISCGRCVAACPAKALTVEKGQRPVLTPRRCIACCCCHEVCPAQAIRMRCSPLLRLMGVFRDLK
jgi:uncharacterized protein (DUF362 family)/ferredoxin